MSLLKLILPVSLLLLVQSSGIPDNYSMKNRFVLDANIDGYNGALNVWVTEKGDSAIVQLTDKTKKVVSQFSREFKTIQALPLQNSNTIFEYNTAYIAAVDSDSGIYTEFFGVDLGNIRWIQYAGLTGKSEKIHLLRNRKSVWKFIDSNPPQILEAVCKLHWVEGTSTLKTFYRRYIKEGLFWKKTEIMSDEEQDFSKSEEDNFPEDSQFPK